MSRDTDPTLQSRIAPDVSTAVLPALAALGAVASIAAVNWIAEDATAKKPEAKRRATVAVQELETCCSGLAEIFRRFDRHPDLFAAEGRTKGTPLKFGVQGGRVAATASATYNLLINDVAAMLVLASQNACAVMAAVEDGEIDAPDAVFIAFGECQDELNHVLQVRASLRDCIDKGIEIADRLTALIRELKKYQVA
ncbi:MAG: hypothetical protein K0U34_04305 [Alphaproteobacteria bacterium]|nr:hypothetical protein [Alphaproteobacteria bacterium]